MQLIAIGKPVPLKKRDSRLHGLITYQTRLIMRLTAVMVLGFCLHVSAASHSQSVTISEKNTSLEKIFKKIKQQTGITFVYRQEWMEQTRKVDVDVVGMPVSKVLEVCFKNQPFSYSIIHNTVVLREKEPSPTVAKDLVELIMDLIIKGRITDEKGDPILGASIMVKGAKTGTATNKDGEFQITVKEPGTVLVISSVGFITQELRSPAQGQPLLVKLESAPEKMDEVVVKTGIFNRKAATYTGAAVTVTAKELRQFGNRSILTSLRNIDPSFNIIESNSFGSDPNRLPEIQIRGNSSIPNVTQLQDQTRVGMNTPLIILDGFESTLQRLIDLNENEVETLTILKDASATSIYGSRGANGVVVIQTKAPMAGRMRVSYRGDINIEAPDLSDYNLLGAKDKLDLEWQVGLYDNGRIQTEVPLRRYYNFLVNEVTQGVSTDWMAIPLRTGVGQRHNIRLEGGDNKFRYSASVQNNNIQGVMKGSFKNTFNGTVNLSYTHKNVKFSNQLLIGLAKTQVSPYGDFSEYSKLNPYWRAYDSTGRVNKFLGDPGNTDYISRWATLPTNPLYNATLNGFDKTSSTIITNNLAVEWKVLNDIIIRSRLGLTKSTAQSDKFRSADNTAFASYTLADVFRKGDYTYGIANGFSYDGGVNISYYKNFNEKHGVFAGFDYNIRQNESSTYSFRAEGFTNPTFDFISMALQYAQGGKPSGAESLTRSVGLTGSVNYTYDDRYYVDASFRRDGSSQFGSKNRFAPFWSTGLGWNLHNEAFFKQIKYIDRLKLRGSLGITGSQNFDTYQALSTYRYYTADRYYDKMGAYLVGLGNDNLKWQQKMNYNVGLEGQLFNRIITFTVDYYLEKTRDLVSSVNLSPSNGFSNYIENIGSLENKGIEAKVTAFVYQNRAKGIAWSVTGAMFRNSNKILHISQALKDAGDAIIKAGGANPSTLYYEGYSSNSIWVVPSLGIDPSTGKELYLAKDGTSTYTWNSNDIVAAGISDPKIQGTFSTMLRVKGFTANLVFGYRMGGQLYNTTLINKVENTDYTYNVDARVYADRWQNPGDKVMFKGLDITAPTQMTSRFVQDENTLTCQSINLMYDLPAKSLKRALGFEAVTISSSMEDLFYLSSVRRERGTTYPFSRKASLTLNLMF